MSETLELITDGSKSYGLPNKRVPVFTDLSLTMRKGSCLAIMGPNACGKSTLIHTILGIESLDSGRVDVHVTERDLVAAVLQDYRSQLLAWASVRANLLLPLGGGHDPGIGEQEALSLAQDFLEQMGYEIKLNRKVQNLSGGQQQAIVLARAVVFSPAMWILDEATSAIDFTRRAALYSLLNAHRDNNSSIIFVSHDLDDALQVGTRLVLFDSAMRILEDLEIPRPPGVDGAAFLNSDTASSIRKKIQRVMHRDWGKGSGTLTDAAIGS